MDRHFTGPRPSLQMAEDQFLPVFLYWAFIPWKCGKPTSKGGYSKVDFCEKQYHNEIGLEYKPWLESVKTC